MSVINNRGTLSGMWEESQEQLIKQDESCLRRRPAFTKTTWRAQALKRQRQLPRVHIWTWHLNGVRLNATCVATKWAEKWRNRSDPRRLHNLPPSLQTAACSSGSSCLHQVAERFMIEWLRWPSLCVFSTVFYKLLLKEKKERNEYLCWMTKLEQSNHV